MDLIENKTGKTKIMGKKFKIVITDFIADSLAIEKEIAGNTAEVIALNACNEKELEGKVEDADAIIMYHSLAITGKTIDRLKHCKLIVRAGVGIDNIDYSHARTRGIPAADKVLIPGDPERMAYEKRMKEGIPVDKEVFRSLQLITEETGIKLEV